ncbi:hypothetical protein [Xylella fastidiosa]|nr:hypothetical protein [Xylella fastidiosa]AIC14161.1 hypothetical protein P303_12400 [Xylella fastidiosa MUL0034]
MWGFFGILYWVCLLAIDCAVFLIVVSVLRRWLDVVLFRIEFKA